MLDLPATIIAAGVAVWDGLETRARADSRVTLRPLDRLAIAALARHICLGEGYMAALTALGNPSGLSASTLSRLRTQWEALGALAPLHALAPGEDRQATLHQAMAGRSCPWYCRHVREQAGRHLRLVRLADHVFDALAADAALPPDTAEWADVAAEHALVASEHGFLCWSVQQPAEAQAALAHAETLLPPLTAILQSMGGRRQCLLTAHAGLIAYGMLMVRDELRRGEMPVATTIRRLLDFLDRHAALEPAETDDERRKRIPRTQRRNYPAWWEAGRTLARFHYWRSLCWLALTDLARTAAPAQQETWGEQARLTATAAYHGYLHGARQDRRDLVRAWHALLLQGEVARATGHTADAPSYAEAAARASIRYHRSDLAATFWLEGAHLWQRSAVPNRQRRAERALQGAWQAARGQDATSQTLVLYRAEHLLGRPWQPRATSRHRTTRLGAGSPGEVTPCQAGA